MLNDSLLWLASTLIIRSDEKPKARTYHINELLSDTIEHWSFIKKCDKSTKWILSHKLQTVLKFQVTNLYIYKACLESKDTKDIMKEKIFNCTKQNFNKKWNT